MLPKTLIKPTTAAVAVGTVDLPCALDNNSIATYTLSAPGLAGTETIAVHFSVDGGNTWHPSIQGGEAVALSVDDTSITVDASLYLSFEKPLTASAVGLYWQKRQTYRYPGS